MRRDQTSSALNTCDVGLARLAELVAARMGLHFPASRQGDLLRGAQSLAKEHGTDTESFLRSLVDAPLTDRQIEILTAHLTVGETYFFRERDSLNVFQNHLIPELIRQRADGDKRIRIWSAGCSSGEEAYSIAMLLAETIPNLDTWNIHILATDINSKSIEKAEQGVYTEWSFRSTPKSLRDRYFMPHGPKAFAVRPKFKNMVSFDCVNLAIDNYPSLENSTNAMDVIFCRNVLMYFVPELVERVVSQFRNCVVDGGWLIVAPCETSLPLTSAFTSVPFERATLYQKTDQIPAAPFVVPQTTWIAPEPVVEPWEVVPPPMPKIVAPTPRYEPPITPSIEHEPHADPYEQALAAYKSGRYAEAKAALLVLIEAERPEEHESVVSGSAYALMARIDADQGNLDQAAEWAERAIAADKVNPGFYYLLATIAAEQNQLTKAVASLRRTLYLDSDFVLAHFTLGHIALGEKGHEHADRHFRNAVAILTRMPSEEVLPESEGVTAGRLLEIIETITAKEVSV